MSHLIFILVCFIWGTSFILMKRALVSFDFISVGAARVLFGALVLGLVWLLRRRRWPLRRKDLAPLTALAAIAYSIPFCMQPYVIGRVEAAAGHGSAFAGIVVSFVPLFTVIVSVPLLNVYPTKRQMAGLIGGLGFIAFLFADELSHGVPLRYLLLGSISPLCYATGNAYIKRRFHHVPPLALALGAMGLMGLILTPISVALETVTVDETFWPALGYLAVLGTIGTGLATYLFYTLIYRQGPLYASMVAYIIPCMAIGVGWLDDERISIGQLVAILGVFAMVGLVQYNPPAADTAPLTPESLPP